MNQKSFIIHIDSLDILDDMDEVEAGRWIKAIHQYQKTKQEPEMDKVTKMAFVPFRNQFIREKVAYDKVCDKNRTNGAKGGRPPKTQKNPKEPQKPKETQSVKKLVIPEFEEFKKYALENGENIDNEKLIQKYKAWKLNGWKDGNNKPIKAWKVKLLNTLQYLKDGSRNNSKKGSFSTGSKTATTYSRSEAISEAETLFVSQDRAEEDQGLQS